jgi:hypothetical protein
MLELFLLLPWSWRGYMALNGHASVLAIMHVPSWQLSSSHASNEIPVIAAGELGLVVFSC